MKARFQLSLAAILISTSFIVSATEYTVTKLEVNSATASVGFRINNSGLVTGYIETNRLLPASWANGELTLLQLTDNDSGSQQIAYSSNDAGSIVGFTSAAHGRTSPTLWSGTTRRHYGQSEYGEAYDINAQGDVVGGVFGWRGQQAVHWTSSTETFLKNRDDSRFAASEASAINDGGKVVGWSSGEDAIAHASLWDRDQLIDLGPGKATDINNAGQIALNTSLNRAAIWENGGVTDLGTLGGNFSWAQGMNQSGAVVGAAELADSARHATLWMNGEIIDLNNVVVGNMAFSVLETAYGINDLGQIVGRGRTVDGQSHAFLLTPIAAVPEPTTWLMLVSGLLLLGGSVKRRRKP